MVAKLSSQIQKENQHQQIHSILNLYKKSCKVILFVCMFGFFFSFCSSVPVQRSIRTTPLLFVKNLEPSKGPILHKLTTRRIISKLINQKPTKFRMENIIQATSIAAEESKAKENQETSAALPPRKKSKRKVGLVIGYVGTAYRGLQINRMTDGGPVTVEEVLEEALYKAGCISESNYGNLDKIAWSRSSRTDKGVHAARLVVCGKLELYLDSFDSMGLDGDLPEVINAHLPEDIRVFSCAKVPKAFRSREACSYREYEYWLPARYLTSDGKSTNVDDLDAKIDLFTEVIKSYEGTHSFHNFQSSRSKEMRKKRQEKRQRLDDEAMKAKANEFNNEEEEAAPETLLRERIILKEMTSNMYSCTVDSSYQIDGERFLRIFIRGQSFLYNQIRMMVGAAMATATGILPSFAYCLALNSPYLIPIPVAPPQGLVLVGQNFARYANAVLMDTQSLKEILGEGVLNDETKRVQVLMSEDMVAKSKQFEEEKIRPEIARAWQVEGVYSEWAEYAERFRMDEGILNELKTRQAEVEEKLIADQQGKSERDIRRRLHKLEKGDLDSDSYREILPNQFSTELCCKFGLLPGKRVADIQRALVEHFVNKSIKDSASTQQILDYVESIGIEALAKQGSSLN